MNLKEKLTHVFSLLGLTQKAKDQSLTDEEWKTVVNRFQQEYKVIQVSQVALCRLFHSA